MAHQAPKRPQDHDPDADVVDLSRYRKALRAQAEAGRKAAAATPKGEPLLGRRRGAGMILVGVAVVAGLLWAFSLL